MLFPAVTFSGETISRRCGYSLYIDLTGLPWEEVWARLREKIIVV